jgi:rfaE bifunctional protein kinase chain/domain
MSKDPASATSVNIRRPSGESSVAFVSGNFNIVHPGHLRLLRFAASLADKLVVGVNTDATPGVTISGAMRLEGVSALSIVDEAVLLDGPPDSYIALHRPNFVVKGKEFENRFNSESSIVTRYGGKLIFSSGDVHFSSLDLLHREYTETVYTSIRKPRGFCQQHGFDMREMHDLLDRFKRVRVTVIGDIIVDDYITCDPLGMSQEDPTIVVTPIETKTFVGGAGVVAAHSHNLGAKTRLFTVFGNDEAATYTKQSLTAMGVGVHAFLDETRPTTRKQRFRAHNKTLLRVNHLRQHAVSDELVSRMLLEMESVLEETDVLLFSDFNYGCLPQTLVDGIVGLAKAKGIIMTADSQASSQMSDISRFRGMSLVTPTEREARLALRDSSSGLAYLAEALCEKADARNVIITLGGEGMLIRGLSESGAMITDRLPAMNLSPKDVAGAGDSLFTATSIALSLGANIWQSSYLGAVAAACQVSRVGNSPLTAGDIHHELDQPDFD